MRLCALLLALLLVPLTAQAERVVLGMSQAEVSISTRFDGSDILIYGAIKRDLPADPEAAPLQVVLTLAGPDTPVVVRRKGRRFGIWVNTEAARIDSAPSYYAVATSADWSDTISETENLRHGISIDRAIRYVGASPEVTERQSHIDALIRIREADGSYQTREHAVTLREETLFDTRLSLPDSLTEGTYPLRVYLTREGAVVGSLDTQIAVHKVGLERWLYNLAQTQALWYGLLSLTIAVAAGWLASTVFRLLRNG